MDWPATRAGAVLRALHRIRWTVKRQAGSPYVRAVRLAAYVFAFHDREEIGPRMLARIAKQTGLRPEDM
jgi:predicted RNA binding protein YcfA (HicA-like mRNA interferase family)